MNEENEVCRFCLNTLDEYTNNTHILRDPFVIRIIRNLLPSLALNITASPVICEVCLVNLKVSNNFMKELLENENILNDKYIHNNNQYVDLMILTGHMRKDDKVCVCRTCLKITVTSNTMGLFNNKNTFCSSEMLRKMLKFFFPQMNFNLSLDPAMCNNCWAVLQIAYNFKKDILEVEQKLQLHAKKKNVQSLEQFDLSLAKNVKFEDAVDETEIPELLTENHTIPSLPIIEIKEEVMDEDDDVDMEIISDIGRSNLEIIETKMEVVDHIIKREVEPVATEPIAPPPTIPIIRNVYVDLTRIDTSEHMPNIITKETKKDILEKTTKTDSETVLHTRASMINKKLISLVKVRNLLWDTRMSSRIRTVHAIENAWKEIYKEMEGIIPISQIKSRWRLLVDQYTKVISDPSYISENKTVKKANWLYLEDMDFLNDINARVLRSHSNSNETSSPPKRPKVNDRNSLPPNFKTPPTQKSQKPEGQTNLNETTMPLPQSGVRKSLPAVLRNGIQKPGKKNPAKGGAKRGRRSRSPLPPKLPLAVEPSYYDKADKLETFNSNADHHSESTSSGDEEAPVLNPQVNPETVKLVQSTNVLKPRVPYILPKPPPPIPKPPGSDCVSRPLSITNPPVTTTTTTTTLTTQLSMRPPSPLYKNYKIVAVDPPNFPPVTAPTTKGAVVSQPSKTTESQIQTSTASLIPQTPPKIQVVNPAQLFNKPIVMRNLNTSAPPTSATPRIIYSSSKALENRTSTPNYQITPTSQIVRSSIRPPGQTVIQPGNYVYFSSPGMSGRMPIPTQMNTLRSFRKEVVPLVRTMPPQRPLPSPSFKATNPPLRNPISSPVNSPPATQSSLMSELLKPDTDSRSLVSNPKVIKKPSSDVPNNKTVILNTNQASTSNATPSNRTANGSSIGIVTNTSTEDKPLQSKHKNLEEFYHGNLACAQLAEILGKLSQRRKNHLELEFLKAAYGAYQNELRRQENPGR